MYGRNRVIHSRLLLLLLKQYLIIYKLINEQLKNIFAIAILKCIFTSYLHLRKMSSSLTITSLIFFKSLFFFLQTYYDICFFHILSLYFFLLQIILCICFLLFLLIILCYFHSNRLLYFISHLYFFHNKLFHSSFIYPVFSFKLELFIIHIASSLLIYQK